MIYLDQFEAWVGANRDVLEQHGEVTFRWGRPGTDNPSAHLLVVISPDEDAELLIWESGDAEFNRGPFTDSIFEHVDLESPEDLANLLQRFLDVVTGKAP